MTNVSDKLAANLRCLLQISALAALCLPAVGCVTGPKKFSAEDQTEVRVNRIAMRPYAPQPTYNRLRWVHPPDMTPSRQGHDRVNPERPKVLPVMHLEVSSTSVKEVALIIGATTRYRTYVSSMVESERVTVNQLGTIDELAEAIERQAPVKVVVDHDAHSIRFMGKNYIAPRFAQ